jgi:hypothetical protein
MPANKQRAALKATLLAPATALLAWGVNQFTAGNQETGVIAFAVGGLMYLLYTGIQEYDMPYEEEIVSVVTTAGATLSTEDITDAVKEASKEGGDRVEDLTDGDADSDS